MTHNAENDAGCMPVVERIVGYDTFRGYCPDHDWYSRRFRDEAPARSAVERHLREQAARRMSDAIPPAHVCPECGEPVTREQPCWVEPETKQRHHDPCPIPPAKSGGSA